MRQDPELMAAFKDPEIMAALQDGRTIFFFLLTNFLERDALDSLFFTIHGSTFFL